MKFYKVEFYEYETSPILCNSSWEGDIAQSRKSQTCSIE